MRKIAVIFLFLFLVSGIMAQDTISEKEPKVFISGFGGILFETSKLDNSLSECIGAAGALTVNHYFFLGAYGLSMTSKKNVNDLILPPEIAPDSALAMQFYGKDLRLNFSHAGICTGFIIFPKKIVHLGINTRIGWGNIHLSKPDISYVNNANYYLDYTNDKVFVITPEIDVDVAITSWLKCNVGLGYRFVNGVDFERYAGYHFNSTQVTVGLFFGGFYNKEGYYEAEPQVESEEDVE